MPFRRDENRGHTHFVASSFVPRSPPSALLQGPHCSWVKSVGGKSLLKFRPVLLRAVHEVDWITGISTPAASKHQPANQWLIDIMYEPPLYCADLFGIEISPGYVSCSFTSAFSAVGAEVSQSNAIGKPASHPSRTISLNFCSAILGDIVEIRRDTDKWWRLGLGAQFQDSSYGELIANAIGEMGRGTKDGAR